MRCLYSALTAAFAITAADCSATGKSEFAAWTVSMAKKRPKRTRAAARCPRLLERNALPFRYQEYGGDELDHVDDRQQRDGDRERILRREDRHDIWPEPADAAPEIEQDVLRRGARRRRIKLGHQRPEATEH